MRISTYNDSNAGSTVEVELSDNPILSPTDVIIEVKGENVKCEFRLQHQYLYPNFKQKLCLKWSRKVFIVICDMALKN